MIHLLRQALLLSIASAVSWWVFLYDTTPTPARTAPSIVPTQSVSLTPISVPVAAPAEQVAARADQVPKPEPEPEPEEQPAPPSPTPQQGPPEAPPETSAEVATAEVEKAPEPEPEPTPPQPELGTPEGEADAATAEAPVEPQPEPEPPSVEDLMQDTTLVETARRELSGESRTGFATVLLATPEDQLAIARFFNEELLLVPRQALDPGPEGATWFHLDLSTPSAPVRSVSGSPPLEGFRQYRDLFEYEYSRLPEPLRHLRKSVLSRAEVYVFAALIPPAEWAAVVGRRREALALSGRATADVSRYVLRYVSGPRGSFDFSVQEIVFSDGERFLPVNRQTDPRKGG